MRVKINRGEPEQDPLAKIIIDGTKIGSLKTELAICGVSEPTIFPDLEGLGRGLKQWWKSQCDYNSGTWKTPPFLTGLRVKMKPGKEYRLFA